MRLVVAFISLLAIPAAVFWASVDLGSSVLLGIATVAAWFAAVAWLRPLRLQNVALVLLSITAGCLALELLLRAPVMAGVVSNRDIAAAAMSTTVTNPALLVREPTLGFRIATNVQARSTRTNNGQPVFDVIYTTDANGHRALPPGPAGDTPVLLLGDSFNFGSGIDDDQTLAFYLREVSAGRLQSVNLSMPMIGIHQVLRQIETGEPARNGHKAFPWAILTIVDDHVLRASGHAVWHLDTPRYEVEAGDRLVLRGTFRDESPFEQRLLVGSRLFALVHKAIFDDPDRDRRRFERILREIKSRLQADFGSRLIVLYYSGELWRGDLTGARGEMMPLLCQAGVDVIDVNALVRRLPVSAGPFYIEGDGHPTGRLNRALAPVIINAMADPARLTACAR